MRAQRAKNPHRSLQPRVNQNVIEAKNVTHSPMERVRGEAGEAKRA